jgi:hypothetical protein
MAITTNGGQPTANVTLSSELAAAITDESGTGALVFNSSPTLVTPTLGTASATAIELGHATDTTLARASAGVVTIEGVNVVTTSSTDTLTNKTLTSPTVNFAILDEPVLISPEERTTISATAAGSTVQFDVKTQGVLYYTTNSTGNWTLNVRGDGSTTLNSLMTTGDALTVVFLATNGVTPYYGSALTIDGSAVTPKFENGVAVSAGNASAIDIYTYTIIKTANATFTVLAGQTKFA